MVETLYVLMVLGFCLTFYLEASAMMTKCRLGLSKVVMVGMSFVLSVFGKLIFYFSSLSLIGIYIYKMFKTMYFYL